MFPVLLDVTRSSSVAAAEEFSDLGRRLEGDLLSGEPLVGSLAVSFPLGVGCSSSSSRADSSEPSSSYV